MIYSMHQYLHPKPHAPAREYVEESDDLWEVRKVAEADDGTRFRVDKRRPFRNDVPFGQLGLSDQRGRTVEELSLDSYLSTVFRFQSITREEFERVWRTAR